MNAKDGRQIFTDYEENRPTSRDKTYEKCQGSENMQVLRMVGFVHQVPPTLLEFLPVGLELGLEWAHSKLFFFFFLAFQ